jgi:hypothetical protein
MADIITLCNTFVHSSGEKLALFAMMAPPCAGLNRRGAVNERVTR